MTLFDKAPKEIAGMPLQFFVGNHENGEWHVLDKDKQIVSVHKTKDEAFAEVQKLMDGDMLVLSIKEDGNAVRSELGFSEGNDTRH